MYLQNSVWLQSSLEKKTHQDDSCLCSVLKLILTFLTFQQLPNFNLLYSSAVKVLESGVKGSPVRVPAVAPDNVDFILIIAWLC